MSRMWCAKPPIYALYLLIQLFSVSPLPILPYTHTPIHPYTHTPIHPSTHTPIHPFRHSNGAPLNIFYSTSSTINKLNAAHLRIPLFQSAELDDNRDGHTDRIEIGVQMPLAPAESVLGFTALVYCEVQLDSKARYLFDAAAYANYESMSAMEQLDLDGDLLFRQTWPLVVKGGFRAPYEADPLLELTTGISADTASISSIMRRYNARNYTMVYAPNYANVQRRANVATDHSSVPYFNASMVIRVPFQPVRCVGTGYWV
jgi:hypothetical protein